MSALPAEARLSPAVARPISAPVAADREPRWRRSFAKWHTGAAALVLLGLLIWHLGQPKLSAEAWSGGLLLVGGALIGIPHGGSDFVVAAQCLRPRFGAAWLPIFLASYLALVALVITGWALVPSITLIMFLILSGLHFGAADVRGAGDDRSPLIFLLRATTPILPIFMFHAGDVGPIIAALTKTSDAAAIGALHWLRTLMLGPWLACLALFTLRTLMLIRVGTFNPGRMMQVVEIVGLVAAAVLLPALASFAFYFCVLHAVRHMADLADDLHPREPKKAMTLVAIIVAPAAVLCLAVLTLCWDVLAGVLATQDLIASALQLTAALTVPHMALELISTRQLPIRHRSHGLAKC